MEIKKRQDAQPSVTFHLIFKYLKNDQTYLERNPLENLSKKGELYAFKHNGFWQCMDTLRDKELLEKSIKRKKHLEL